MLVNRCNGFCTDGSRCAQPVALYERCGLLGFFFCKRCSESTKPVGVHEKNYNCLKEDDRKKPFAKYMYCGPLQ